MDETGNVYGRLTVVSLDGKNKRGLLRWHCQCRCGKTLGVYGAMLRNGNTKSCGCLRVDTARRRATRHGMTGHPALTSYQGAKNRCTNRNDQDFSSYGGRGIEFRLPVFEEFWATLGAAWFKGATLDRKDNNGHYEIGNVRWATRREQCMNTSRSVTITFDGETRNLCDWAVKLGIAPATLRERLDKWTIGRALTTLKIRSQNGNANRDTES